MLEPVVVVLPLLALDALHGKPALTRATGIWLLVLSALLALAPGARSQYRIHRDGFNSRKRARSKAERRTTTNVMVASGLLLPFVPPVPKAVIAGTCAGILQGAVIGSELAYARLLRRTRSGPGNGDRRADDVR